MARIGFLLAAILYGSALMTGLSNAYLWVSAAFGAGGSGGNLPLTLAAWGIVLYIHYQAGWFPFRRSRRRGEQTEH